MLPGTLEGGAPGRVPRSGAGVAPSARNGVEGTLSWSAPRGIPPGSPGPETEPGARLASEARPGPVSGSLGTIIPLSLANSSSSSSTRFSAWECADVDSDGRRRAFRSGEAGGGGADPAGGGGSRGDSDGPTSGADSSAFAAVVSAIPALRSFAHWCTSPAYFFATCTRMMLNLDRIFPSRTHRYCLFPRYSTCADKNASSDASANPGADDASPSGSHDSRGCDRLGEVDEPGPGPGPVSGRPGDSEDVGARGGVGSL